MPLIQKFADASAGSVGLRWSFNVSANRLWDTMIDRQALPLWLGTHVAGSLDVGSTVKIEHAEDYICESRIEQVEPGSALLMSWKFPEESASKVSLTLQPSNIGVELALSHSKLSVDVSNYLAGWQTHLMYLEAVLLGAPRSMGHFWDLYREVFES
ncbi:SRPBCC domain-containing protein [Glutamicibacter sp.]|uniref:SRPBCC domain-containing protein n=1 Tax=Glutamicibacter sp. TaxID=1931995 RepID=UPI003D6B09CD